jgi:hypothetical protein
LSAKRLVVRVATLVTFAGLTGLVVGRQGLL